MWANDILGANGYAIFDRSENRILDKKESDTEKRGEGLVNRELLVYELWNGKWKTIQSDSLRSFLMDDQGIGLSIRYTDQELSLISISDTKESRVMRVNVAENKVISDVQVPLQAIQKERGRVNWSLLEKDRLHLLMPGMLLPSVAIVDLQTGKIIFLAEVQQKDHERISNLAVYGINVKK